MVIASFLRLVTHPKIFIQPTPIIEALRFMDALLNAPQIIEIIGDRPRLNFEINRALPHIIPYYIVQPA
jgi:hypothetical protein